MSWLGKIVGGAIGFALAGPLGAVAGATFGHAFDKEEERYLEGGGAYLSDGENEQLIFFVAAFSMLAKLAGADGRISEEEIRSIEEFMDRDLRLDREGRDAAIRIFQSAKDSPQTFQAFASQFYQQFHDKPQLLEMMIDILLRVSVADGALSREEEELILSAVNIFRFSDSAFHKIKSKYVDDRDKWYAVLGCERNDSVEVIKKQYRKLVHEYHPDKIAAKGLPDEFIQLASEKFREIQEAYDIIKKERGFS